MTSVESLLGNIKRSTKDRKIARAELSNFLSDTVTEDNIEEYIPVYLESCMKTDITDFIGDIDFDGNSVRIDFSVSNETEFDNVIDAIEEIVKKLFAKVFDVTSSQTGEPDDGYRQKNFSHVITF